MDHNLFNWLPIERHSACSQSFPYRHCFHEYPSCELLTGIYLLTWTPYGKLSLNSKLESSGRLLTEASQALCILERTTDWIFNLLHCTLLLYEVWVPHCREVPCPIITILPLTQETVTCPDQPELHKLYPSFASRSTNPNWWDLTSSFAWTDLNGNLGDGWVGGRTTFSIKYGVSFSQGNALSSFAGGWVSLVCKICLNKLFPFLKNTV